MCLLQLEGSDEDGRILVVPTKQGPSPIILQFGAGPLQIKYIVSNVLGVLLSHKCFHVTTNFIYSLKNTCRKLYIHL